GLLAFPLAIAGLGVALFHVSLEVNGKLECPTGVLGLGTAPKQSLGTFAVLVVLLALDVLRGAELGKWTWPALLGGVVLGGLLSWGSCISNPPMPKPPTAAYSETEPDVCRPPFHPQ